MTVYDFVIAIGTVVFILFLWTLLTKPFGDIVNISKQLTFSYQGFNKTTAITPSEVAQKFDIPYEAMYISLFFLVVLIMLYVVKRTVQEKERFPWR
jgi:hypothetical protein